MRSPVKYEYGENQKLYCGKLEINVITMNFIIHNLEFRSFLNGIIINILALIIDSIDRPLHRKQFHD